MLVGQSNKGIHSFGLLELILSLKFIVDIFTARDRISLLYLNVILHFEVSLFVNIVIYRQFVETSQESVLLLLDYSLSFVHIRNLF